MGRGAYRGLLPMLIGGGGIVVAAACGDSYGTEEAPPTNDAAVVEPDSGVDSSEPAATDPCEEPSRDT